MNDLGWMRPRAARTFAVFFLVGLHGDYEGGRYVRPGPGGRQAESPLRAPRGCFQAE